MIKCDNCGMKYKLKPSRVEANKRGVFFCCMDCKNKYYKKKRDMVLFKKILDKTKKL